MTILRRLSLLAVLVLPLAATAAPRTIQLAVTEDGFVPNELKVKKGEPLKLVVTRKTDATCANEIIVDGYGIEKKLPLNQPVAVEFTPNKTGQITFGCAMGRMIGGVISVE
ncbi:MAG TPA: cupredoxin domain-containing protein [Anaeromyxobacteraceae bacterium]|nr:cupredoxin domain-containing protein [Anaeromyxobacteraceae bacterium]